MGLFEFLDIGGTLAYLLLLAGVAGIGLGILQLVLAKRWDLTPLMVGVGAATILLGIFGTVNDLTQLFDTLARAGFENMPLFSIGFFEALTWAFFGVLLASIQTLVGAIALTVRANVMATCREGH